MELLKPSAANSSPLTPLTFLERASTAYSDCTSIVYNATSYTWSHTHRRCLQLASSIASLGIKRHDVVAVVAFNVPAMYELHFAVPMSGAILSTINTRLDARTVSVLLRHSESKLVFVDQSCRSLVVEAVSLFPIKIRPPVLILITDHDDDDVASPTTDFATTYEGMVENGDPGFEWVRPESEWDPMVLNYTSGTTSSPKGVVHCHRGLFIATVDSLIDWAVPKQPVYLWTLPMFHANGWSYTWGMAAVGGTNICLRKFDAPKIYGLIERHGVTHMCGAPVVLNMLLNSPQHKQPLKNPVQFLTAGAPPPATVLFGAESLGFVVSHGYGLTETAGLVVSCAWRRRWNSFPSSERAKLKARQGVRTIGMAQVDVVDPNTGRSVKPDGASLGEIAVKGSSVMLGYLKDPEATSFCMREKGRFYTGDVGVVHPDGYVEIRDRSKDVIISGGENVCSAEVESVVYSNPAVKEVAVVARKDKFWGETPCAFVSLKSGLDGNCPSEKEIMEFCRKRLPHYMAPKTVVFKEELPKTATGKIQKFLLRDIANSLL
ncbi:hypothetical protein FNV43_RR12236 [Rhamnella rubrinervis]|uniref:4-coumarate--CoA ligase n=1 Tax=Rhamnella rubrinervis TaxID=2594499 RepID=A0A8K0H799_9ROSA|nr:hypothetical protein FNV43_RR12236 [Rhamnella rubrinervis]